MDVLGRRPLRFDVGRRRLLACAALVPFAPLTVRGAEDVYDPDTVKAAFLYRFTGFIDWPVEAMLEPEFAIAVLGAPAIAAELGRVLPSHHVKDLPAVVRPIATIAGLGKAQVLYVGTGFTGSLRALIEPIAARPILVVTDRDGALDDGSAVNFLLADRRVRFEISVEATQKAGLRVGPALLAVAASVRGAPRT